MTGTFADLPDALVRELLEAATPVSDQIKLRVDRLRDQRSELRDTAGSKGLIRKRADLEVQREPSIAGIDGSYQIHRLTALDLCAAAAVAVEGTAIEATRYWAEPYHQIWVDGLPHGDDTTSLLRSLMVSMELELIAAAPHDMVLLDGSFASVLIYLNQGFSSLETNANQLVRALERRSPQEEIPTLYAEILRSDTVVAVPKYTTRNELALEIGFPSDEVDGRTLATLILEPGEFTQPAHIYRGESFHLPPSIVRSELMEEIDVALSQCQVVYYRPYGWVPALRLELPGPVANSPNRLALTLEGITRQFFSPAVTEPYPLFLADRMVKSLGAGVHVVEQTVAQAVIDDQADAETTMLFLQNYRTEGGRGGV